MRTFIPPTRSLVRAGIILTAAILLAVNVGITRIRIDRSLLASDTYPEGAWVCVSGAAIPEGPMWVPRNALPTNPGVTCTDEVLDAIASVRGGVRPVVPNGPPQ